MIRIQIQSGQIMTSENVLFCPQNLFFRCTTMQGLQSFQDSQAISSIERL